MKQTKFITMCGGLLVISALCVTVGAQASRTSNDGVFTAEQAKRGDVLYKEQCATCHGDNLEGSGPMPPLAGKDFLTNWHGKTVGELYEKVHTTMPATAPGTLTPNQSADIVAHMLSASMYPAGTTELEAKAEALTQIKIEPPKTATAGSAGTSGAAPGTTAPGTTAPGTTAPGTTAPSTSAPSTPAPTSPAK